MCGVSETVDRPGGRGPDRHLLPRSRPSDQGVHARAIDGLLDDIAAHDIEVHSLMVLRHGVVVAEGWWAPYTAERKHLVYSLSKSFTSVAMGFAVDAGLVGLDDRVLDHLGAFAPDEPDERYHRYLVRHALSMSSGHEGETLDRVVGDVTSNSDGASLRAFFGLTPEHEPGTVFAYNQLTTYSAARVLGAVTGLGLLDWLTPRLFDPLGADEVQWMMFDGYEMGFSGIHVRTETVAKLGQLMLQGGRWAGRQVLSDDWVRTATTMQMPNDVGHLGPDAVADPNSDWQQGYGFQFWLNRHGFRGDGAFGQFCIVWPEEDAVIVTTAETTDMQTLLNLITEHLRPAMGDAPFAASEVEDALAARLARLAISLPEGTSATFDAAADVVGVARGPSGSDSAPDSAPEPGERASDEPAPGEPVPGLQRIRVAEAGEDWLVTFERAGLADVVLPVGRGRWLEGAWPARESEHDDVPFVSAAAVASDGGWWAELRMIQTPHTLLVGIDPSGGKARVAWRQAPLRADGPEGHSLPRSRRRNGR